MKKIIFPLLLTFIISNTFAQSVGIGTTTPNPGAILDLTSTNKGLLLPRMTTGQRGTVPAVAGMVVYDTDFKEYYHHDGVGWKKMLNSSFWNSSSTRSYIYNTTDSIGIGTSTPDEKLHVYNGNIYVQDLRAGKNPHVIFDVPATNFKEGGLQFTRAADTLAAINYREVTGVPNYIKVAVSNNGTGPDLVVNTNGFTGLGITEPLVKLHLYDRSASEVIRLDAENPMIQLRRRTSPLNQIPEVFANIGFVQTNGDDFRIGTNSSNNLGKFVVRTNSTDRLFIDASGNVSIGTETAAPGYMLRIGGKMICEEVKVKLEGSWPDYVFKSDYKLMPLPQLKSFLALNNHLPKILPAADMEKNGINVGEMQKKMMEKIEELTLYILQLHSEIEKLKTANAVKKL